MSGGKLMTETEVEELLQENRQLLREREEVLQRCCEAEAASKSLAAQLEAAVAERDRLYRKLDYVLQGATIVLDAAVQARDDSDAGKVVGLVMESLFPAVADDPPDEIDVMPLSELGTVHTVVEEEGERQVEEIAPWMTQNGLALGESTENLREQYTRLQASSDSLSQSPTTGSLGASFGLAAISPPATPMNASGGVAPVGLGVDGPRLDFGDGEASMDQCRQDQASESSSTKPDRPDPCDTAWRKLIALEAADPASLVKIRTGVYTFMGEQITARMRGGILFVTPTAATPTNRTPPSKETMAAAFVRALLRRGTRR
eukprot:CAMPEP_0204339106 /NCGR_PEP_ID=MMETSP0469-20131031/21558_1 /ASSEMBLY_ACC=CAM_ASM_000384 /TAXON_ID=2969 /ORGANISM="Oxyrrhis marina" /LENGTH=316 /DNA_ID=CAMNT_0051323405 /DNA_START=23 /DNA_END=969 /DNA_ORIENTATION=+